MIAIPSETSPARQQARTTNPPHAPRTRKKGLALGSVRRAAGIISSLAPKVLRMSAGWLLCGWIGQASALTTTSTLTQSNAVPCTTPSWSALNQGLDGTVLSLATCDDGTGLALYAAGDVLAADNGSGPFRVNHIAKWNGFNWSRVSSGT